METQPAVLSAPDGRSGVLLGALLNGGSDRQGVFVGALGTPFGALLGVGRGRRTVLFGASDTRSGAPFGALLGVGRVRHDGVVSGRFLWNSRCRRPPFWTKSIAPFWSLRNQGCVILG